MKLKLATTETYLFSKKNVGFKTKTLKNLLVKAVQAPLNKL